MFPGDPACNIVIHVENALPVDQVESLQEDRDVDRRHFDRVAERDLSRSRPAAAVGTALHQERPRAVDAVEVAGLVFRSAAADEAVNPTSG